jgi:hypothetical protein
MPNTSLNGAFFGVPFAATDVAGATLTFNFYFCVKDGQGGTLSLFVKNTGWSEFSGTSWEALKTSAPTRASTSGSSWGAALAAREARPGFGADAPTQTVTQTVRAADGEAAPQSGVGSPGGTSDGRH